MIHFVGRWEGCYITILLIVMDLKTSLPSIPYKFGVSENEEVVGSGKLESYPRSHVNVLHTYMYTPSDYTLGAKVQLIVRKRVHVRMCMYMGLRQN